ncbi:MAG TPA: hypothetical protein VML54_12055 [Candidatus Limnocylindrales bacterium]|nr:hypothetical protein [Candidatus Limnocylindrales bacterium]
MQKARCQRRQGWIERSPSQQIGQETARGLGIDESGQIPFRRACPDQVDLPGAASHQRQHDEERGDHVRFDMAEAMPAEEPGADVIGRQAERS